MTDVEVGFGIFIGLAVLFVVVLYLDRKRML
jgi:hypothetical protein